MTAGFFLFHKPCFARWLLPSLVLLLVGGCGGSGLVDVRGKVTYDGQPVQRGTIAFFPSDGKGPTTAALITNGRYMLKVPLGRKRVKIEGGKVVCRSRASAAIPPFR